MEDTVEQNRHLIAGKPVEMNPVAKVDPVISLPLGVFAIAVSNLIRNACQFTLKGTITVTLKSDRIEVSAIGSGIEKPNLERISVLGVSGKGSSGFGFGLDIVNRLCDQFGWRVKIDSTPGEGTITQLVFSPDTE